MTAPPTRLPTFCVDSYVRARQATADLPRSSCPSPGCPRGILRAVENGSASRRVPAYYWADVGVFLSADPDAILGLLTLSTD